MYQIKSLWAWGLLLVSIFPYMQLLGQSDRREDQVCKVTLIDKTTRDPMPGAIITLLEHRYSTNTEGTCLVKLPDVKSLVIHCYSIGYETETKEVNTPFPSELIIEMKEDIRLLSEVVITAKTARQFVSRVAESIDKQTIRQNANLSVTKLLENIPGVSSIQSGATITKPVIQGMHSNRILLIANGVPLSGQSWGADHAPEIDVSAASKIEVIKGAESIRYGAGALGGVVLLQPEVLSYGAPKTQPSGYVSTGVYTNGRGMYAGQQIEIGRGKWALRLQSSQKNAGDYKAANYTLNNTGIREFNSSAYAGYNLPNGVITLYFSSFYSRSGIFYGSHVGGLADLLERFEVGRPLPVSIKPFSRKIDVPYQQVKHFLYKAELKHTINRYRKLDFSLSFQNNHREEYENRRSETYNKTPIMDLHLHTLNADGIYTLNWKKEGWKNIFGISGIIQKNVNRHGTAATPFIPNYTTMGAGAFATQKIKLNKVELEAGLRYDFQTTDAAGYDWRRTRYGGRKNYSNLTGNLGLTYQTNRYFSLRSNIGLAWRAPDVNELYSNGLHHGLSWQLGNAALQSERGYKGVFAATYANEFLSLEPGIFFQKIDHYIYDSPDKSLGEGGIHVHWNGVYPIFAYTQNNSHFWGGDFVATLLLPANVKIGGKGEWIRGKNIDTGKWLPFIPSDKYTINIQWHSADQRLKCWSVSSEIEGIYALKQTRFDPEKEFTTNTPPAYFLVGSNIQFNYKFSKERKINIILSAENALNALYKEYTDRFRYYAHQSGRNIRVQCTYEF